MKTDIKPSRSFTKLKNKSLGNAITASVLVGLTLGALASGVLLWLFKLDLIAIGVPFIALIGIGAFLLSGVGMFFLLHRSDAAIARMLDRRFVLHERVQTMMAYRTREETIYALQREDAEAVVKTIPGRSVKIRFLWLYILCLVLSSLVLVGAVLYTPVEPPPPPVEEVPFEITAIQIAAMEELIEYVNSSAMESPYRENIGLTLSTLLDELKIATTVTERDASVGKALKAIYNETDASSSAVEIIEALWGSRSDTVKHLAEALNYYVWQKGSEWDEYVSGLADVRVGYVHPDSTTENPDIEKMVADVTALLASDSSDIVVSLTRSGIDPSDALYVAVSQFASADGDIKGLSALAALAEELNYTALEGEIDSAFSAVTPILYAALEKSSVNTGTGEYAMRRICDLFEHALPNFERPILRDSSTESGDGGGDDTVSGGLGGIGSGTVFGSDDLVLDPYTDKYVEYGTILDKYYSLMFGKTEDGDYTEEQIAALKKYFEILYGGFEDQD